MRIITLDQSTRTGWAIGDERDRSNTPYRFGSFRMPKRDDPGERLCIFRDGLVELIEKYHPDIAAYETPFFPVGGEDKAVPEGKDRRARFNVQTVKFLHNLEGVLIETTARYSIPTEHFPSTSWRVTALGYGRLPPGDWPADEMKRRMIKRAKALGYDVADDNEADAIGMLMHMLHGPPAAKRAQGDLLALAGGL